MKASRLDRQLYTTDTQFMDYGRMRGKVDHGRIWTRYVTSVSAASCLFQSPFFPLTVRQWRSTTRKTSSTSSSWNYSSTIPLLSLRINKDSSFSGTLRAATGNVLKTSASHSYLFCNYDAWPYPLWWLLDFIYHYKQHNIACRF